MCRRRAFSLLLSCCFSCPIFFFCWVFTRKASFWWQKFLGKVFWSYRIRWKEVWVVVVSGTRFSSKFSGQLCMVFSLPFCLSPWLNHAHFGVVWKISSSCTKYWQSCPWPLRLMTMGTWDTKDVVVLGGSGANGLDSWSKNGYLQWSLLIVPTDHELLGSMMSRLAQAEQQLKAAQTQLLERVKKNHCKYLL